LQILVEVLLADKHSLNGWINGNEQLSAKNSRPLYIKQWRESSLVEHKHLVQRIQLTLKNETCFFPITSQSLQKRKAYGFPIKPDVIIMKTNHGKPANVSDSHFVLLQCEYGGRTAIELDEELYHSHQLATERTLVIQRNLLVVIRNITEHYFTFKFMTHGRGEEVNNSISQVILFSL
jgi:hypothetical protein